MLRTSKSMRNRPLPTPRSIAERKRTQEQFQLAEANYRTIFDNSSVAITVADENENIVYWNRFAEVLLGMGRNDLYMKPVSSLYPDAEWRTIRSQNVRQKGIQHHLETRIIRKNQEIIDVGLSLSVLKGPDGKVTGSIGIIADITARRRAQEQLQLADENYETIFENSSVAITLADENENIVSWNKFAEALLRMGRDDLYMKPVSSLYPDAEWRKIRSQNVRQKGIYHHLETRIIRKNQEIIDVDLSLSVLKGPDGKVTGSIGIIADITARRRAQEQLQLAEDNYRTIFDNSSVAITVTNENENIVSWNKFAEVLLGMDKCDLYMKPVSFLYPDAEWRTIRSHNIRQKGMQHHLETRMIRKNQEIIDVDLSLSVLKGPDGKVTGSIGIIADISERKRAQEEKERMEEQLQLAGRLATVGQLAAGVAHELNNPLSAVQAFAQLLADRDDLDETVKSDVETIYKEIQRAIKITSNLLSFARRHKPEKSLIPINGVLERSLEFHAYLMRINNVEVVKEFDPDLPRTMADFHQMQQVFVNIINNAEQAMTEAHGKGKLIVKAQSLGETIRVAFTDDGPGISEENLKRVFDPFFTTKDAGNGTGLGLSICFSILQDHGGNLYVESKPGEGATFIVEIPIVSQDQLIAEQNGPNPEPGRAI